MDLHDGFSCGQQPMKLAKVGCWHSWVLMRPFLLKNVQPHPLSSLGMSVSPIYTLLPPLHQTLSSNEQLAMASLLAYSSLGLELGSYSPSSHVLKAAATSDLAL